MTLTSKLSSLALAGFLVLSPLQARAKDCTTAKDCYQKGAENYQIGDYESALNLFRKSYSQASDRKIRADLLFNIGRVHENLGRPDLAKEHFNLYLAENPQSDDRESIESRIEALSIYSHGKEIYEKEDFLGAAEIFKKVYGMVSDDNLRVVLLYDIAQSYEKGGKTDLAIEYYNLYLEEEGARNKESVEEIIERLEYDSEEIVATPVSEERSSPSHIGSIIAGSVGAAALIGGGISGYLAKSKFDDLSESCAAEGCPEDDINKVATLGKTANVLFIVGGVVTAIAIPLYLWESKDDSVSVTANGVKVRF